MYETPRSIDGDELTYSEKRAVVEAMNEALIEAGRDSATFCAVAEPDDTFIVEFEGPGIEAE